ncbi:YopX family protein [Paenibacillus ehimensis]|uniref:YopX family protein n=1 Tax=Paenibacillus ehimensis TaxID=79264 RepID=UPI00046FD9B3|nr:YopX family protein [Paenibacillus ehimensis]
MREYKFRGRRIDTGEWAYGNYQAGKGKHPHVISWWTVHQSEGDIWDEVDVAEVDPETVGQCTGLIDRNGQEIFEGDFVRFDDNYMIENPTQQGYVGFGSASFYIDSGYGKHYRWIDYDCEVIGNVWQHPHLLEEAKSQ